MLKIILDTHMFLWAISVPEKISKDRRIDIQLLSNTVFLSSISIAELAKSVFILFQGNLKSVDTSCTFEIGFFRYKYIH